MVAGINLVHQLGITKRELIPVSQRISGANGGLLPLLGGLLLEISGTDSNGSIKMSKQLVYISEGVTRLLQSKRACKDLEILAENFPSFDKIVGVSVNKCKVEETNEKCSCPVHRRNERGQRVPWAPPIMNKEQIGDNKEQNWGKKGPKWDLFGVLSFMKIPLVISKGAELFLTPPIL